MPTTEAYGQPGRTDSRGARTTEYGQPRQTDNGGIRTAEAHGQLRNTDSRGIQWVLFTLKSRGSCFFWNLKVTGCGENKISEAFGLHGFLLKLRAMEGLDCTDPELV